MTREFSGPDRSVWVSKSFLVPVSTAIITIAANRGLDLGLGPEEMAAILIPVILLIRRATREAVTWLPGWLRRRFGSGQ